MNQNIKWINLKNSQELLDRVLRQVTLISKEAIARHNAFHIVLSGGNTPKKLYQSLVDINTNWNKWHIWFGDERRLPILDSNRNSQMAAKTWLEKVTIPTEQVHVFSDEVDVKKNYQQKLKNVDLFDLVLLGLGVDGHTASLFPNLLSNCNGSNDDSVWEINSAPAPFPKRFSLSPKRLSLSRKVIFMIDGKEKASAINNWQNGVNIPATEIIPVFQNENSLEVYYCI